MAQVSYKVGRLAVMDSYLDFESKSKRHEVSDVFAAHGVHYMVIPTIMGNPRKSFPSKNALRVAGGYLLKLDSSMNVLASLTLPENDSGRAINYDGILVGGKDTLVYIFSRQPKRAKTKYFFYRYIVQMELTPDVFLLDQFDNVPRGYGGLFSLVFNESKTRLASYYPYFDRTDTTFYLGVTFYDEYLRPGIIKDELIHASSITGRLSFRYVDHGPLYVFETKVDSIHGFAKIRNIFYISQDTSIIFNDTLFGKRKCDRLDIDQEGNVHVMSNTEADKFSSFESISLSTINAEDGRFTHYAVSPPAIEPDTSFKPIMTMDSVRKLIHANKMPPLKYSSSDWQRKGLNLNSNYIHLDSAPFEDYARRQYDRVNGLDKEKYPRDTLLAIRSLEKMARPVGDGLKLVSLLTLDSIHKIIIAEHAALRFTNTTFKGNKYITWSQFNYGPILLYMVNRDSVSDKVFIVPYDRLLTGWYPFGSSRAFPYKNGIAFVSTIVAHFVQFNEDRTLVTMEQFDFPASINIKATFVNQHGWFFIYMEQNKISVRGIYFR